MLGILIYIVILSHFFAVSPLILKNDASLLSRFSTVAVGNLSAHMTEKLFSLSFENPSGDAYA